MSSQCLFRKIVAGEIQATQVSENDQVLAFMDINPINRGHLLVIPKKHAGTVFEIEPEALAEVMTVVHNVAKAQRSALEMPGLNILQSNGRAANQLIDHFHVHLIPRWPEDNFSQMDWEMVPGDMAEISTTADKIKKELEL